MFLRRKWNRDTRKWISETKRQISSRENRAFVCACLYVAYKYFYELMKIVLVERVPNRVHIPMARSATGIVSITVNGPQSSISTRIIIGFFFYFELVFLFRIRVWIHADWHANLFFLRKWIIFVHFFACIPIIYSSSFFVCFIFFSSFRSYFRWNQRLWMQRAHTDSDSKLKCSILLRSSEHYSRSRSYSESFFFRSVNKVTNEVCYL